MYDYLYISANILKEKEKKIQKEKELLDTDNDIIKGGGGMIIWYRNGGEEIPKLPKSR